MPSSSLTLRERELIRREFCRHFGQNPSVADGILLRTWRSGPHRGEPKIPLAVQGLLDRGLVEVGQGRYGSRAFFTEAGLAELRALLENRRAMDPERFAHLRRELGLEAGEGGGLRPRRAWSRRPAWTGRRRSPNPRCPARFSPRPPPGAAAVGPGRREMHLCQ